MDAHHFIATELFVDTARGNHTGAGWAFRNAEGACKAEGPLHGLGRYGPIDKVRRVHQESRIGGRVAMVRRSCYDLPLTTNSGSDGSRLESVVLGVGGMEDEADRKEIHVFRVTVRHFVTRVVAMLESLNVRGDVRITWQLALVNARPINQKTRVRHVWVKGFLGSGSG